MSELYDSNDYNDLKFEYVGPTKDVSFYEHRASTELFNAIKNNQIKFSEVMNEQKEFLNKLSNVKQRLDKKLLIFLETILKCYLMLVTKQNNLKLKEQDLKY